MGQGPATFEEMGIPQGKNDGDCVSVFFFFFFFPFVLFLLAFFFGAGWWFLARPVGVRGGGVRVLFVHAWIGANVELGGDVTDFRVNDTRHST
jgi:hypothetical protein